MAQKIIASGRPPLLWSDVDNAFQNINQNFTELYLTIGGSGVDLENFPSNLIPDLDITRDLGSSTKRWRDLYLSGSSIYLGNGNISADESGAVNLPAGSKVGGNLIRDPAESSFKTINITGQPNVVANDFAGVLNFTGTGITLTTNAATDTINFINAGVTSVATGTGISTSAANGNITLTNTGVTSITAGTGIGITSGTGAVIITNSNPFPQNIFRTIAVSGQSNLIATTPTDTLSLAGSGISITTDAGTNTVTFSLASLLDIKGSIFGDDSSTLVDGTTSRIVGPVFTSTLRTSESEIKLGYQDTGTNQGTFGISLGHNAGDANQGISGIAIGFTAGSTDQGEAAIAIGSDAANTNQGNYAIAIGLLAGGINQGTASIAIGRDAGNGGCAPASIILNATGSSLTSSNAGLYIAPIRQMTGPQILYYDPATKEISYENNNSGEMVGSVFAENSTLLVDGFNGQIVGPINSFDGGNSISMTIGGVIIGGTAGAQIIGAAGAPVYIGGGSSGSTTGNIYIGNGTNRTLFVSNIISTDDSSTLIFDPPVDFNTNVSVGGDLTVIGIINGYISLDSLKSVVAASTSFNDFQARIAVL